MRNMSPRFFFIAILFLVSNRTFGQVEYYVELSGNYSFIKNTELIIEGKYSTYRKFEEFTVHPGINTRVGFMKYLTDKFSINSGIGFSLNRFKFSKGSGVIWVSPIAKNYETIGIEGSKYLTDGNDIGETSILYITVPLDIYYTIAPEKIRISLGMTNYLIAYSSQIEWSYKNTTSDGLNNYQLNGDFSVDYKLCNNLWLRSAYSHGFLRIYDKQPENTKDFSDFGKGKYRRIELGLRYYLK